jgi:hypothetical protein
MSVWWQYFWPIVAAGVVIGVIAGLVAFRRTKQRLPLAAGAAAAIAAAALWHGPLDAADKLANTIERDVEATLTYYEMTAVDVRLQRDPLTRTLALKGPADDFQRGELVRVLNTLPGVSDATWSSSARGLPLLVEGALAALAGYLAGLVLAYLVELRRRHNAQWKW